MAREEEMTTYTWDEISGETLVTECDPGNCPGWKRFGKKLVKGCKVFMSDRRHWALECEAPDQQTAEEMFTEAKRALGI